MRNWARLAWAALFVACGPAIEVDTDGSQTSDEGGSQVSITSASTTRTTSTSGTVSTATSLPTTTGTVDVTTDVPPPPPPDCLGAGQGNANTGDPCAANSDCSSGVCGLFRDSPPDLPAVCLDTPAGCETRITATLVDITSQAPVTSAEIRVLDALDAITNPSGAPDSGYAIPDGNGRVDFNTTSVLNAPFGIVGAVDGGGLFTSGTWLATPDANNQYAVGIDIHEVWTVPNVSLDTWSTQLVDDPGVSGDLLPLGQAGGVVGIVRDKPTGFAVPGATVVPADPGSAAVIRYVADNGTIVSGNTGINGVFIAVGLPVTGEDLVAVGPAGRQATGTIGTSNFIVFTLALDLE